MKETPSSTCYDPDITATKERLAKGVVIDRSPKYDEVGFLRLAKRSPSPTEYDVKDHRTYAYTERFRAPITVTNHLHKQPLEHLRKRIEVP